MADGRSHHEGDGVVDPRRTRMYGPGGNPERVGKRCACACACGSEGEMAAVGCEQKYGVKRREEREEMEWVETEKGGEQQTKHTK